MKETMGEKGKIKKKGTEIKNGIVNPYIQKIVSDAKIKHSNTSARQEASYKGMIDECDVIKTAFGSDSGADHKLVGAAPLKC